MKFPMLYLSVAASIVIASPLSAAPVQDLDSARNILLIIADDLGTDMLAAYGTGIDIPSTPNIDALARESVLFRNAWSNPLCSPTRASIQTGRFGFRTGIGTTVKDRVNFNGLFASEIILPEMLDAGTGFQYQHALFGKWHLNHETSVDLSGAPTGPDVVRVQGYGHHEGIIHNILAPDSYSSWPKVSNGLQSTSTVYATTAIVDDFLHWQRSSDAPYFAVISFTAPHTPIHAPPGDLHSVDLSGAGTINGNPRPYYKAMVEALDTELGRLLRGIAHTLDNTTIIFMGDNGTPGPIIADDPNQLFDKDHGKGQAYEGGVNIPMLIAGPLVAEPGSECGALVNAVDIFATVADLAGVDLKDPQIYPPGRILDSISLVPYLERPSKGSVRKVNFTEKFFENTVQAAGIDETQLSRQHICQEEAGFASSATAPRLTMCGQAIVKNTDNESTLRVAGAFPDADLYLLAGRFKPISNPAFGGATTISPKSFKFLKTSSGQIDLSLPLKTDQTGALVIPGIVHQVSNPTDFFIQVAVQDPLTAGWSISNAILFNQTVNVKAMRNKAGYKLVAYVSGGPQELYFLPSDPMEQVDLLAGGIFSLTAVQWKAYEALRGVLAGVLNPE